MIFETDDLSKGWDGKANDERYIAQSDVYVWNANIKLGDEEVKIYGKCKLGKGIN